MDNIHKTLLKYADDSQLEVIEYSSKWLRLKLLLDCERGKSYLVTLPKPVHLDMPPKIALGRMEFGNQNLLPRNYTKYRYQGYEGDEYAWRVLKMIDDEDNCFYVIYSEQEFVEPEVK